MSYERTDRPGRHIWPTVCMYLTAIWLFAVVAITNGDQAHPLYEYIYIVPLAVWLAAIAFNKIKQRRDARSSG